MWGVLHKFVSFCYYLQADRITHLLKMYLSGKVRREKTWTENLIPNQGLGVVNADIGFELGEWRFFYFSFWWYLDLNSGPTL
jgi:hypothetical protein